MRTKIKFPNNVPSPTARYFVGREKDLENLHQIVQNHQTVSISAILGMGGIGKTELAKYYAIIYQKDYPDGIAWLTFGKVGIAEEIVSFGSKVLNLALSEDAPIQEKVDQVWQNWQVTSGALVIIDNVNRKEDYDKIKPYLPKGTGFKIVLTSRVKFSNIPAHHLELLDLDKAVKLLESLADAEHREWNRELATTLCKDKLGCLPLAITLVGCYLANDRGLTLEKVINRLNRKGLDAKPLIPADSTVAERGVKAAIELTYEVLEAECQDLAVFLSLFACAPLEWRLVESALGNLDPDEVEDQRGELLRYSLLDAKTLENTKIVGYQFHPLVWEFFREKVIRFASSQNSKGKRQKSPTNQVKDSNNELSEGFNESVDEQVIRDFVKAIVTEANTIEYNAPLADYERVRPSIPHIEEVAEVWMDYVADEDIIDPCNGLARFYKGLVNYVQAETWLHKNIQLVKKRLSYNHLYIPSVLNNLAELYQAQGKYCKAQSLYQKAVSIATSNDFNDSHLATIFNNYAESYREQGKYRKAKPLYLKALKIARKSLPRNHYLIAIYLNNLALLYESQNKYSKAESLYLKALDIARKSLPSNHPQLASHFNGLALLYQEQGKYSDAEPLYVEAIEIDYQSLPPNHPQLARHLNNLAELYKDQGKYSKAEPLYVEAIEILREALGEDHPTTQKVMSNYERMQSKL